VQLGHSSLYGLLGDMLQMVLLLDRMSDEEEVELLEPVNKIFKLHHGKDVIFTSPNTRDYIFTYISM